MSLLKAIERIKRMDDLISRKATGTPDEFAEKLGISKSMLMVNLIELKEMGALVKYDIHKQAYYYCQGCRLKLAFELTKEEMNKLKRRKKYIQ